MSTVRMLSPFLLLLLLLVPCHSLPSSRATGVAKQLPAQLAVHKKLLDGGAVEGAEDLVKGKGAEVLRKGKDGQEVVNKGINGKDANDKFRDTFSPPPPLTPAPTAGKSAQYAAKALEQGAGVAGQA